MNDGDGGVVLETGDVVFVLVILLVVFVCVLIVRYWPRNRG